MTTEKLGFGTENGGTSTTWINLNNGKLTVRANEGDEGAVARHYTTRDGTEKTVWEHQFPTFAGIILGAQFVETEYGIVYAVDLDAGEKQYQLRLNCPSRLFDQFTKRIPNISLDHPLIIGAFLNEKGGNVLYLKQNGAKVPMAFTKDNPNGIPAAVKTMKRGQEVWDFSDQEEFLYQLAKDWLPASEAGAASPVETVPTAASTEEQPF